MLAERVGSRKDAALTSLLRPDVSPTTSSTSNSDVGEARFLEPAEISRRVLKDVSRDIATVGFGSAYQTNMRITLTLSGHGEIQTGNVEPLVVLFPSVRRQDHKQTSYTVVFGNVGGVGVVDAEEQNVPAQI